MYCSILTSGVAMVNSTVKWVALASTEGCGVAYRTFDERRVFSPKLRLFGQVILGVMWGIIVGGWFGSDYAAMVRGMAAPMRSKARR